MLFNPVEKIEYMRGFYDFGLVHFVVTKKYVIKSNGDLYIFYYKDKSTEPYKELHYSVSSSAVKRVFRKVDFIVHHANVRVSFVGGGAEMKIYHKLFNCDTVYRGLGIGIVINRKPKVLYAESTIYNFVSKYDEDKR